MKPVLPAFAGHVPQELKRIYPDAKITKLGAWAGYSDQYACSFLDPMDPLFTKIQKMFLEEQNSIYGTDHIYGIDLFNELEAPSYEPSYLRRVSRQVYQSLEKADKKAVWLQMTWLFWNEKKDWTNERIKAYITAFLPRNRCFWIITASGTRYGNRPINILEFLISGVISATLAVIRY